MTPLKPFRPAEFTEYQLLNAIMNGVHPPGSFLPSERQLAEQLGVTRPTLRETLQRLSREGWVTIRHGKPTLVNDYLKEGGLGVLRTIARFGDELSHVMVEHLLEVRCTLLPPMAAMAVEKDAEQVWGYLKESGGLGEDSHQFAVYDWDLQMLLADLTGNPIYRLIMNDFSRMFEMLGQSYFEHQAARDYSRKYYQRLMRCIADGEGGKPIERLVLETMENVVVLWKQGGKDDGS